MTNGHELAAAGADTALAHAGQNWADEAFRALCWFAQRNATFMTEDVRHFAHGFGLPLPPDGRAWGGVINRALRKKLIERVGYAPMKSPNCHADPKSVWKWVGK